MYVPKVFEKTVLQVWNIFYSRIEKNNVNLKMDSISS